MNAMSCVSIAHPFLSDFLVRAKEFVVAVLVDNTHSNSCMPKSVYSPRCFLLSLKSCYPHGLLANADTVPVPPPVLVGYG